MWPKEYTELKLIEDLLVCGICYDYMETSVITLCSHNYCSLCIRKYLHYKTQCPACFAETFEKDLRKNKVLDEIIAQFLHVKKKLQRCLQQQIHIVSNDKDDETPSKSKYIDQNKSDTPSKKQENKISSFTTPKNNGSPSVSKNQEQDFSSPSTSGRPKIPLLFTPKSRKVDTPIVIEAKSVMCPVCKVTVSEGNINRHLDDCLKREAIKEQPQKVEPKRKPLPKLVFSLMKDSVIRKKVKELGLSTQGDRKVLEARFQRYTVLYNAECDKLNPRPVSELLKQCEEEEQLEKKVNKTSLFINRLQVNRNTEQNIIEDERKKYLEVHKDSFESLIAKLKNPETPKKSSVRRSILDKSRNAESDVQNANDTDDDKEMSDFQGIHDNNINIEDSDSDNSCPLQTYSSTDPMTHINAELSVSNENIVDNVSEMDQTLHTSPRASTQKDDSESNIAPSTVSMLSDKRAQQVSKAVFQQDTLEYELKNQCDTPRSRLSLQRRARTSKKRGIKRLESLATGRTEFKAKNVLQQEDLEDKNIMPTVEEFIYDLSSNDSHDSKSTYAQSYVMEDRFLNDNIMNFSSLEKENISSSPECSDNRTLRKRNHNSIQSDNTAITNTKKKIRKSAIYLSENEESNTEESVTGILHDSENARLRKKSRLKKQDSNILPLEETTVLRKSSRTRFKTNIALK